MLALSLRREADNNGNEPTRGRYMRLAMKLARLSSIVGLTVSEYLSRTDGEDC